MGAVYRARDLLSDRLVALKRLHPELASDGTAVRRFQREARIAGRTGHPNIVEVLDIGFAEDGAPYMAMELLRGRNLATVLRKERRLSAGTVARTMVQVLDALSIVHGQGVIHRDLKPDNIFLHRPGDGAPEVVKVLDFGVSKVRGADPDLTTLTRTGVMVGTPHYMSPEQARGTKAVDHRVDLYACGVILYESLCGERPFRGDNYHALLQAILASSPTRASVLADLPSALVRLVHRCLASDPAERYESAAALRQELAPFAGALPRTSSAPAVPDRTRRQTGSRPALRPFVAQSGNWLGDTARKTQPPLAFASTMATPAYIRTPSPRSSLTPLASGPPPVLTTPSEPVMPRRTPVHSGDSQVHVKAGFVLAGMDHLRDRLGEDALQALIDKLHPSSQQLLRGVLMPMTWLPVSALLDVLRTLEQDDDDEWGEQSQRFGWEVADRELPTTHRVLLTNATPGTAMARISMLWRAYFDTGRIHVTPIGDGQWHLQLVGGREGSLQVHAMAGFYQRLMERSGAREVSTRVIDAPEDSPEERGVIALHWR